jgi:dephospho-CoA kinase
MSSGSRSKEDLPLDRRPVIVALAGPNGAGKTTFYHAHLQPAGLRFVNADVLARELNLDPYAAARLGRGAPAATGGTTRKFRV